MKKLPRKRNKEVTAIKYGLPYNGRTLALVACALLVSSCGKAPDKFGEDFGSNSKQGGIDVVWGQNIGGLTGDFVMDLVDGQICVANEAGRVLMLDRADGSVLNAVDLGTPILAGGACTKDRYVGLTPAYRVHGYDLADSSSRWQVHLTNRLLSAPVLAGSTVILFQSDGAVRAYSLATGDELWRLELEASQFRLDGNFRPVIDSGVAYFGMPDGNLYAIDYLDGFVIWQRDLFQKRWPGDPTANLSNIGEVAIDGDFLCASAFNGAVSCFDRRNASLLWQENQSSAGSLAAGEGNVFFIDPSGALVALAITDGTSLWRSEAASSNRTAQVVFHGGKIVVDNGFAGLSIYDPASGELTGGIALRGRVVDMVAIAGDLVVLTTQGEVFRLKIEA